MRDAESCHYSKHDTGVIIATGYGALNTTFSFLDSYIEKGDKLSFPIHFSNSVHNAAAAHISSCYGLTGSSLTISQLDMSFISALLTAKSWLSEKKVKHVLLGCSDEYCDVLGYCIHGFSKESDLSSDGYYLSGEGASFFMLSSDNGDQSGVYGYIDRIKMGNTQVLDIDLPEKTPVLLTPGSLHTCQDKVRRYLAEKDISELTIRYQNHYPTNNGDDLAVLAKQAENGTTCLLKLGQEGEWGSFLFQKTSDD